jgi:predicted small metal-binding protein
MKTLTCADMGGPCDTAVSGATADELVAKGMDHLNTAHPDMAADVAKMTPEQMETWNKDFHTKFDATPETV